MLTCSNQEVRVEAEAVLQSGPPPAEEIRTRSERFILALAAYRSKSACATVALNSFHFLFHLPIKARGVIPSGSGTSVRFLCCEVEISACAVARAPLSKRFTGRFSAFQGKRSRAGCTGG